jgi:hypothetical protein
MDPKTYEINNLRILNDYLTQTIEVLARTQRINCQRDINRDMTGGLSHTPFGPSPYGVPVQGMPVDPRTVDYHAGLGHSPYGMYPYNYGMQATPWTGQQATPWTGQQATPWTGPQHGLPTNVDPFYAQRTGLSHTTNTPWTGWNPVAAEIARQREFARQQYEAMWRPFGF